MFDTSQSIKGYPHAAFYRIKYNFQCSTMDWEILQCIKMQKESNRDIKNRPVKI